MLASLESKSAVVSALAGQGCRLFGAVTGPDIAEAVVAAGGPQIDKRKVEIPNPIKAVGEYSASVRLHPELQAQPSLEVVAADWVSQTRKRWKPQTRVGPPAALAQ